MLEILALIYLCTVNKSNAEARGRKPGGFIALTIILWLGLELLAIGIGNAAGLGLTSYALGIAMAVIGGLISYLVAKNCKPGTYVPPAKAMEQAVSANPQMLGSPATITVVRDSSMVGALAKWDFLLNGNPIGTLANGHVLTVNTNQRQNVLVAKDSFGNEPKPFMFEVTEGMPAEVHFKAGRFLPNQSTGLALPSQPGQPLYSAPEQPVQPVQPVQATFCQRCGTQLPAGADACTACGEPRFVAPPMTGVQTVTEASDRSAGEPVNAAPISQGVYSSSEPTSQSAYTYSQPTPQGAYNYSVPVSAGTYTYSVPALQGAYTYPVPAYQGVSTYSPSNRPEAALALDPEPKRAVRVAICLLGAWLLIFLFHMFLGNRLLYCSPVTTVISDVLLGSGLYLLLQRDTKLKVVAGVTFVVGAAVSLLNYTVTYFSISGGVLSNNSEVVMEPLSPVTIGAILLHAATVAGGGLLFGSLLRRKRSQAGLSGTGREQSETALIWRTALYTALSALGVHLIFSLLTLPPAGFNPARLVVIVTGSAVSATTLFLTPPVLQRIVHLKSNRIRLSGWGLVWCWLVTVSLSVSLIFSVINLISPSTEMYSSQLFMSIAALVGFIQLIAGRRVGWYFVLFSTYIALVGQFELAFFSVVHGVSQFIPLLLAAVLAALNPLITWFSIRSAWLAADNAQFARPVAAGSSKPYKPFDKFVAIFNLVVGSVLIIFLTLLLLDGAQLVQGMLMTFILGLLMVGFSIPSLLVMKRRYPTRMRVVGIVIFSLAILIVSALLITLIVEAR